MTPPLRNAPSATGLPATPIDHLSDLHPDGDRYLRGIHAAGGRVSDHELSADHHWRRQRRDADRADGSRNHATARGSGADGAGPRRRPLGNQPRLRRDQPVLQLERRHAGDAPARRCGGLARTEHPACDRADPDASPGFLELPDHRVQPHVRYRAADATCGSSRLTKSSHGSTGCRASRAW